MRARRLPIVVLVPLVVVALALAAGDHGADLAAPITPGGGDPLGALIPTAAPGGALASTFYCAGGSAAGDQFDATVVIANPGLRRARGAGHRLPRRARRRTRPASNKSRRSSRSSATWPSPAVGRAELRLGDVQASPFAAALVEVNGGNVAVERRTAGPSGLSASPCTSTPSSSWYLPSGTTTKDARELLALFNPFPDSATVDLSFITSDGFRAPPPFQGLGVPAGHLVVLDVGTAAGRHEQVSTEVLARSGRLVVDRLQSFDGTDPNHPLGAAVTLAAAQPSTVAMFPEGLVSDGLDETFTILNPGEQAADVQLEIALDDPSTNGVVDPIVSERAGSVVRAGRDPRPDRVPPGVGHTVTVRATSGVPVVRGAVYPPRRRRRPARATGLRSARRWSPPAGCSPMDGRTRRPPSSSSP